MNKSSNNAPVNDNQDKIPVQPVNPKIINTTTTTQPNDKKGSKYNDDFPSLG